MKDYLLDIVNHTVPVGSDVFQQLKIIGDDGSTEFQSSDQNKRVILKAKAKNEISEFQGTFGIPNLNLLNSILKIPEYEESPNIQLVKETKNGVEVPSEIHFKSKNGDFENRFRLLSAAVINSKEKELSMKVNDWPIKFEPTVANYQRLSHQATANPEEIAVEFHVHNGTIEAKLGDEGNHNGKFMFQSGVDESMNFKIYIPVQILLNLLKLNGDKTIFINKLAMMVRVDSNMIEYDYIMPSLSK